MTIDEMLKAAGPVSRFVPAQTAELITGLANAVRQLQAENGSITAENVGLKGIVSEINNALYGQGFQVSGWHLNGALEPLDNWFTDNGWGEPETPATDAAIAALRAEGVEMFAAEMSAQHAKLQSGGYFDRQVDIYAKVSDMAQTYGRQLRESKGAQG